MENRFDRLPPITHRCHGGVHETAEQNDGGLGQRCGLVALDASVALDDEDAAVVLYERRLAQMLRQGDAVGYRQQKEAAEKCRYFPKTSAAITIDHQRGEKRQRVHRHRASKSRNAEDGSRGCEVPVTKPVLFEDGPKQQHEREEHDGNLGPGQK